MFIDELKNFDWADLQDTDLIGDWPTPIKVLLLCIAFAICISAAYFLRIQNLQHELQAAAIEENNLRIEFERKAFSVAGRGEQREQATAMEQTFTELLRRLPSEAELPALIDDITATGENSNLEFSNITPASARAHEFYIELPIDIKASGSYHDFGTFVSGVASLNHIVTLHDFAITVRDDAQLTMNITAHTYRYRTDEEAGEEAQ
ncbi:MAG: type 4a pilus biogenesis protein PilO [Pseudohongiellaceae bacterium]